MHPPSDVLAKIKFDAATCKVTGRTPEATCLLCQIHKADKPRVHIIPKFLTDLKGKRSSHELRFKSQNGLSDGVYTENTPYEDYLVCSVCEQFFASIERVVSNEFFPGFKKEGRIISKQLEGQQGEVLGKACEPSIFLLFVYSVMWRTQQTYHPFFRPVAMASEEVEEIRKILFTCQSNKPREIVSLFNQHCKQVPFTYRVVFAHGELVAEDFVVMGLSSKKQHHALFAGEIFFSIANFSEDSTGNNGMSPVEIDIVSVERWRSQYQAQIIFNRMLNEQIN